MKYLMFLFVVLVGCGGESRDSQFTYLTDGNTMFIQPHEIQNGNFEAALIDEVELSGVGTVAITSLFGINYPDILKENLDYIGVNLAIHGICANDCAGMALAYTLDFYDGALVNLGYQPNFTIQIAVCDISDVYCIYARGVEQRPSLSAESEPYLGDMLNYPMGSLQRVEVNY